MKRTALKCIQRLALTRNNYDVSIGLYLNKLLSLTHEKTVPILRELRKLPDTRIFQIRNLETVGVKLNNYGGILFAILVKLFAEENVFQFNSSANVQQSWNCYK